MAKVIIYTTRYCPYCTSARELLLDKGVPFEEIDVSGNPEKRRWLQAKTGRHTVPQIFINHRSVGGYDDIAALDDEGELDRLLAAD